MICYWRFAQRLHPTTCIAAGHRKGNAATRHKAHRPTVDLGKNGLTGACIHITLVCIVRYCHQPCTSTKGGLPVMFRCLTTCSNAAAMTPSTSSAPQCSIHALPQMMHRSLQGRRLRRAASNGTRCTAFFKFKNLHTAQLPAHQRRHACLAHAQASTARSRAMTTARTTSSTTSTTWACWRPRWAGA